MKAYRTYLTITDPGQVVLTDLPFQPGEHIEVLLLAQSDDDPAPVQELVTLLKTTQALPHIQALNDEEIEAEVDAYRKGQ